MAYQHKMQAHIQFMPGITSTQVAAALQPLAAYWGWPSAGVLARYMERDAQIMELVEKTTSGLNHNLGNTLQAEINEDTVLSLALKTNGEVGYGYDMDILPQLAGALEPIAVGGSVIECHDVSNPEVVSRIWISTPSEQSIALEQQAAIDKAVGILVKAGIHVSNETIEMIKIRGHVVTWEPESDTVRGTQRPRP